ncbi:MAG: YciI family protein [Pseudomonadaceae bacterium]|jgi:hypothetical protein|uniref:YciI family protein n=1 Tax=Pseudomonas marincola TaxID=437900 RepID=UPI0008550199|nr:MULTISPECIES: YciI family protein [Pseudomonas]MAB99614.1 YciI family protein [Pseudomonadaceae bacterium]MBQ55501.1 YciI family protein [Pseudomonadaceae bacterium]OEO25372.1 dehydrogenase [Pseudomonas sp. J237]HCP53872.1 YciI family protein [Pseudomonas sp.]|tara:strand:- start:138 stop:557 length:420 start_codon:yes stop_codon:yes gene_type:complete
MRFMVMVKASPETEAGIMPTRELLTEMGRYNEALVEAGVLVSGEGLKASRHGARVRFSGASREVVHGPFGSPNDLVAGFWIFRVDSLDEAIEWVKRCPNPMISDSDIEIRQILEDDDFGAAFDDPLREQEAQLRERLAD